MSLSAFVAAILAAPPAVLLSGAVFVLAVAALVVAFRANF